MRCKVLGRCTLRKNFHVWDVIRDKLVLKLTDSDEIRVWQGGGVGADVLLVHSPDPPS